MNWEAIGTIAEFVGAVAAVVSLLYVAVQIRQSTLVSRSSARQAIADSTAAITADLVMTNDMADLVTRDIAGEELKGPEILKLYARAT